MFDTIVPYLTPMTFWLWVSVFAAYGTILLLDRVGWQRGLLATVVGRLAACLLVLGLLIGGGCGVSRFTHTADWRLYILKSPTDSAVLQIGTEEYGPEVRGSGTLSARPRARHSLPVQLVVDGQLIFEEMLKPGIYVINLNDKKRVTIRGKVYTFSSQTRLPQILPGTEPRALEGAGVAMVTSDIEARVFSIGRQVPDQVKVEPSQHYKVCYVLEEEDL